MTKPARLALIAAIAAKLGSGPQVAGMFVPSRDDVREEIALATRNADDGRAHNDFDDMPASRELVGAFES